MIAKKRVIRHGREFDALIPFVKAHKMGELKNPRIEDTMGLVIRTIKGSLSDTKKIAPVLKGATILETCRNIYQFIIDYVQYEYDFRDGDIEAIERVRDPCILWRDRVQGSDCEDYAIFISSCLVHLKIPHSLRIAKYGNSPSWQHIYVVAYDGSDKYITVDPVVDYMFNHEVAYSQKKDYPIIAYKGAKGRTTATGKAALAGVNSHYQVYPRMKRTIDSIAFTRSGLSGLGAVDDNALKEALLSYKTKYKYTSAGALSGKIQGVRNWLKSEGRRDHPFVKYIDIMASQSGAASNQAINDDIARFGLFGAPTDPAPQSTPITAPTTTVQPSDIDGSGRNDLWYQQTSSTPSTTGTNLPAAPVTAGAGGEGFEKYLTKKNMLIAAGVVGAGILATSMMKN